MISSSRRPMRRMTISAGDGFDAIDHPQAAHAVLIDLNTGTATGFDAWAAMPIEGWL